MKYIKYIIRLIVFLISITLIISQYKAVGKQGLLLMILGLVGLLALLYEYNRPYFPDKKP